MAHGRLSSKRSGHCPIKPPYFGILVSIRLQGRMPALRAMPRANPTVPATHLTVGEIAELLDAPRWRIRIRPRISAERFSNGPPEVHTPTREKLTYRVGFPKPDRLARPEVYFSSDHRPDKTTPGGIASLRDLAYRFQWVARCGIDPLYRAVFPLARMAKPPLFLTSKRLK